MSTIYTPDKSLVSRLNRRVMPYLVKKSLPINLDRPIVSFSFDDCPQSVVDTALPLIEAEDWQASLYISMGLCDFTNHLGKHVSKNDVKAVHESGHEIADHTFDHIDATTVTLEAFEKSIEKNQTAFKALGIPASKTFAYPFGQLNSVTKKMIGQKFKGARGIESQINTTSVDLNQIKSNRLYSGPDFEKLLVDIKTLENRPGWMTIFTHDVRDKPSAFGCTPEHLKSILTAVKKSGAQVMTVAKTIDFLESKHVT